MHVAASSSVSVSIAQECNAKLRQVVFCVVSVRALRNVSLAV